ncbi:MAG TPA: hypothetical protein VGG68_15720 [Caulobacteraceae bacterium]|jgi:hypothetical protein
MAYTDINDVLPWLRGGQPQPGAPPGPPAPGSAGMGWLQYLSSMFGPQAVQQAAMQQAQSSIGDAIAGTLGANQATGAPMQLPGNAPAAPVGTVMPQTDGPDPLGRNASVQPVSRFANAQPAGPLTGASDIPPGPMVGNGQPGYVGSGAMGFPRNPPAPPSQYVGTGAMAFPRNPGPSVGNAGGTPIDANAPAANVQPVSARTPAVNPRSVGGQSMEGVTANSDRFIPIQYQTGGGMAGRNAPIYTAANFGGPQTAAMLAPQGYMRQPVPGPMARGGGMRPGQFPYGKSTTPGGPFMPFDITGYPVAGVNAPLGKDPLQLSGAQLASAVHRPDWTRTIAGGRWT